MDTTTLAEAKAVRAAVADEMTGHVKACGCWRPGQPGAVTLCPEGWEIAKRVKRAAADVIAHTPPAHSGQESLF